MGRLQHIGPCPAPASGGRGLRQRVCLRKGCGRVFQPRRWNQRYCQAPECLRLVRRWQAAKRQRQRREQREHRQQHCEAERQRRQRCRERAATRAGPTECHPPAEPQPVQAEGAWSRSKHAGVNFCDRPGCHDPVRCGCRIRARFCGDACALALRRVRDRERKWLRRNTHAGRFKRQLEYDLARRRRAAPPTSLAES
jgi:hypothetical protein